METIHVLLVEDEAVLCSLLQDTLEEGGFGVIIAVNSSQAISVLEDPDQACRALITDIHLGRDSLTGWDIAKRARELNPLLPIIYMSGGHAIDWPANGVPNSVLLAKPFAQSQVLTAVTQLLNATNPAAGD